MLAFFNNVESVTTYDLLAVLVLDTNKNFVIPIVTLGLNGGIGIHQYQMIIALLIKQRKRRENDG